MSESIGQCEFRYIRPAKIILEKNTHFGYAKTPITENKGDLTLTTDNFTAKNSIMENMPEDKMNATAQPNGEMTEAIKIHLEAEQKISRNIMSIRLSPEGLVFRDTDASQTEVTDPVHYQYTTDRLSGVYCQGVQYFDLSNVHYINNAGMATLIDLLKSLLEMGVEVQFVNVDDKIKGRIKQMGLEKIINCNGKNIEKRLLL